jgi:predicted TIM-barrel fold metal-dependent hydrolase
VYVQGEERVMDRPFVLDGVSHAYQVNPENWRNRYGQIFSEVMWSFHPVCVPPEAQLTKEQWLRDWQAEDLAETVFLESETDMLCTHSIPVYDGFYSGAQSIERGAEVKRRYPDRTLWYAGVPVWEGKKALDSIRHYVEDLGADGLKFYPSWYYEDGTRWYSMDDPEMVYPILDLARELGVTNIAVHKALPVGPVDSDAMRVNDIGRAALRYPDLNFQIVHAGFMFMDETKALLMGFPNIYCTLEGSFLFLMFDKPAFADMMRQMIVFGGPDRVIFSANAPIGHPHYILEEFAKFEMPEGFQFSLTDEMRAMILGGNLARLHGIDVEERRKKLAEDEFSREISQNGRREPFTSVKRRLEQQGAATGVAS